MKSKSMMLAAAVILSAGFISMQKAESNTGSIKVTVMAGDKPANEALVGIATSEENLENSKYVAEGETNSTGVITFKAIAPGTYYVDASLNDFYGEAKVTVADGEASVTVKMTVDEDEDEDEDE